MNFSTGVVRAGIAALMSVLVSGVSVQAFADEAAKEMRHRAKLAHLEAQQALDLQSKFQKMATQARELVYTLPVTRRPDASKRADVLQKSAQRAQTTHTKLAAYADQLDRQLANLDIAAADRIARSEGQTMAAPTIASAVSTMLPNTSDAVAKVQPLTQASTASTYNDAGQLALDARASATQAKTHSGGLRLAMNEAKAELMRFDATPGSVDSQAHERAREKVRSLTQEAKIAAWQYRDLDARASALEAQARSQ